MSSHECREGDAGSLGWREIHAVIEILQRGGARVKPRGNFGAKMLDKTPRPGFRKTAEQITRGQRRAIPLEEGATVGKGF